MKLVFDVVSISDILVHDEDTDRISRTVCLKLTDAIRSGQFVDGKGMITLSDKGGALDNFRVGTTVELGQ